MVILVVGAYRLPVLASDGRSEYKYCTPWRVGVSTLNKERASKTSLDHMLVPVANVNASECRYLIKRGRQRQLKSTVLYAQHTHGSQREIYSDVDTLADITITGETSYA